MQLELAELTVRNAQLESDLNTILAVIQQKGVFTVGDMAMLAVARNWHKNASFGNASCG